LKKNKACGFLLMLCMLLLLTACPQVAGNPIIETGNPTGAVPLTKGVVTVSNKSSQAVTLFAGTYHSLNPEIVEELTLDANSAAVEWILPHSDSLNIWYKAEGVSYNRVFYCANQYAWFQIDADTGYRLTIDSLYGIVTASIFDDNGRFPGDWQLEVVDQRSFGQFSNLKNGYLKGLPVSIINSPDWTLGNNDCFVVLSTETASSCYLKGVIRLQYNGTDPRTFVSVGLHFLDNNGKPLFFYWTYINGTNMRFESSEIETSTCVATAGEFVRLKIIENIKSWGADFSKLASVELYIRSSSASGAIVMDPPTQSTPFQAGAFWILPFTNNTGVAIENQSSVAFFKDSQNREYFWSFMIPVIDNAGTWEYTTMPTPADGAGHLSFYPPHSSFFTETWSIDDFVLSLSWKSRGLINPASEAEADLGNSLRKRRHLDEQVWLLEQQYLNRQP